MNGRKHPDETVRSGTGVIAADGLTTQERAVLDAIRATPFGTVEVVLHQSRIVQVVRTEKVKLESDSPQR